MEFMDPGAFVMGLSAIGAAICSWPGMGTGLGQGLAAAKVAEAVARQPEARGAILSSTLVAGALAETTSVYGLLIAIMLLYVNPFIQYFT